MSDIAIRVQGLGKQYHLGQAAGPGYETLRDSIASWVSSRWNRRDRRVSERTIWALKDVNFEVKRGEVVGIIGRNGAGKSTLLKIISRITEPTAGSVDLFGRVGSLLEVGTGFHAELSGRENIFLNGAILGMQRVEIARKFDEIVDFAEVEQFIDTPVKHYSSGMYLRLAFAVAVHLEPEILLVDEVLAVGDAAFQKKCLGKIGEVANAGRTVLFVSHNMAYLNTEQHLPLERACDLLEEFYNHRPSEGTIVTACAEAAQKVQKSNEAVKEHWVAHEAVGHFDETGMMINGVLNWLHTASTSLLTYYAMHPKRGGPVLNEINILPRFKGRAVHDDLASYFQYEVEHALV